MIERPPAEKTDSSEAGFLKSRTSLQAYEQIMSDQATTLRGLMERHQPQPPQSAASQHVARAKTIAVTSGKGGVGKSNIALNLAVALAQQDASVCLLDANLGLGNIDLLCGADGYWNLSHVMTGARTLREIILVGPAGIHLIPGASGLCEMADCPGSARQEIFQQLEELEQSHDFLLIDTSTGIHRPVRQFVSLADTVLVVTTPEPTSITDSYATLKALANSEPPRLDVLVNQADSAAQAESVAARLRQTARSFLHIDIGSAGWIPHDREVPLAVLQRRPFQLERPHCPAARAITQLAHRLKGPSSDGQSRGSFFPRFRQRLSRAAS